MGTETAVVQVLNALGEVGHEGHLKGRVQLHVVISKDILTEKSYNDTLRGKHVHLVYLTDTQHVLPALLSQLHSRETRKASQHDQRTILAFRYTFIYSKTFCWIYALSQGLLTSKKKFDFVIHACLRSLFL